MTLVRATRLAWIEAAQEILKEGKARSGIDELGGQASAISAFDTAIRDVLRKTRDHALNGERK